MANRTLPVSVARPPSKGTRLALGKWSESHDPSNAISGGNAKCDAGAKIVPRRRKLSPGAGMRDSGLNDSFDRVGKAVRRAEEVTPLLPPGR
jgi:hypothetical protein